jgi:UDP-N-acetylglucosamine 1-carboxyvinyltransferase
MLMVVRLAVDGGIPLQGTVSVSAAKNAALPALAAALLTTQPLLLENVPDLADVATVRLLLQGLGADIGAGPDGPLRVRVAELSSHEAPYELVSTMRASVLVLGPLLARSGLARVALPGGCAIGLRPIDQHLKGLQRLGAEIAIRNGYVEARASRLKGARITNDLVTVTGTENLLMAATLAEGTTVIENAAREPEVVDLARLLAAMGARIDGEGTDRIEVHGVPELGGARHRIIPDRIEAGTFLVAAAITGGDVVVEQVIPRHLTATLAKLEECGAQLTVAADRIRCKGPERPRATDIVTSPFPGFATDMQAQFMALLGLADGLSKISETIFENRFMHAAELCRMGARIETDGATAVVRGVSGYQGAPVMATDLRASASLVLAGLAARGRTEISRVYHIDRGYERLEIKLQALGAHIARLQFEPNRARVAERHEPGEASANEFEPNRARVAERHEPGEASANEFEPNRARVAERHEPGEASASAC